MKRNPHFEKVASRYLFQEIRKRTLEFRHKYPEAPLISLSIGDTTEPIGPHITSSLQEASRLLGEQSGYSGYGPEQGFLELRESISQKIYQGKIAAEDIFISDGAKCDIGRLQVLFGPTASIALQDPAYPVYLDTALLFRGGPITLLPCTPENNFLPDLNLAKKADVLFLCLPNNPTGTAFSPDQLETIVRFAKKQRVTIVFDTAYSFYVQDGYPKSIYEIPGADEVAIELGSFSKIAGFSGIRLSWTVIPGKLCYSSGEQIKPDWMRIASTFFNGASIISQKGALAALSDKGLREVQAQINFYSENTAILARALQELDLEVYGGRHSPYLWVRFKRLSSWQAFDKVLETTHIVTTPGVGFGPSGEGFLRISGFGTRSHIQEAAKRFSKIAMGVIDAV